MERKGRWARKPSHPHWDPPKRSLGPCARPSRAGSGGRPGEGSPGLPGERAAKFPKAGLSPEGCPQPCSPVLSRKDNTECPRPTVGMPGPGGAQALVSPAHSSCVSVGESQKRKPRLLTPTPAVVLGMGREDPQ